MPARLTLLRECIDYGRQLLRRFARDEQGVFVVIFAVMAAALIAISGAVVDYTRLEQARARAQNALDSAVLALQRTIYNSPAPTEEDIRQAADAFLRERVGGDISLAVTSARIDFSEGKLTLSGSASVDFSFVRLVGVDSMDFGITAQAAQGGRNVEIAVALDTTGSMQGQRMVDLVAATNSLIDLVVSDVQSPVYSKIALVPYSLGVNLGSYAALARGDATGPKTVSTIAWTTGGTKSISAISKANPARITTSSAHGLSTGDYVYVNGIYDNGWNSFADNLNGRVYRITRVSSTQFSLDGVSSSTWLTYNSGGSVQKCLTSGCELVVTTSSAHGIGSGQYVYMRDVGGWLGNSLNGNVYAVGNVSTLSFSLASTWGPSSSAYSGGGKTYCVVYGCEYYLFKNPYNEWRLHQVSTCLSERVTNAFDDTAPSVSPLGMNYPASANPCSPRPVTPLTSDKATLHAEASALTAGGSTGGHIGVGWTWYMLSPNFGYMWPVGSQPGAYDDQDLMKIAVIMTDGEYNSTYCTGVISNDSTYGSGATSDHINCNAPNGTAYHQAQQQCAAMKARGVIVYTVGFDLVDSQNARDLMSYCATDADHAFSAANGAELQEAFRAIGNSIKELRLAE